MAKLNVGVFALAFGCMWALIIFALGAVSAVLVDCQRVVNFIKRVYVGYGPDIKGSIIGAVWAFGDGAISGLILAWIINQFIV